MSAAPKAKAADIPTPIVEVVPDYDTNVEANFKVPTLYIRNKKPVASMAQQGQPARKEGADEGRQAPWLSAWPRGWPNLPPCCSVGWEHADESVEYNLELEDEEWLQRHRL